MFAFSDIIDLAILTQQDSKNHKQETLSPTKNWLWILKKYNNSF